MVWMIERSAWGFGVQEIVSGGGKTAWGDPAEVAKVVGAESFDVVLDNNGKDLDTVRCLCLCFRRLVDIIAVLFHRLTVDYSNYFYPFVGL